MGSWAPALRRMEQRKSKIKRNGDEGRARGNWMGKEGEKKKQYLGIAKFVKFT